MLAPHRPASSFALALAAALAFSAPTTAQKDVSEAAQQKAAFLSSAPWQGFLADVGGEWSVEWCAATGTPGAIWGSGVPLADWRVNSLEEARRHANALLRERSALLGLGDCEFREVIGARMSRVWTFTFDQFFRGIPVLGGRADVRVHMVGRVPMFGAKAWRIPADFDVVPSFDADTALAIAWQQAGAPTGAPQPAAVAAPRLVLWADVDAATPQTPRLCWEVAVSNVDAQGKGPIGRYHVDARTGAVVRFHDDKHQCGIAGCTVGGRAATSADDAASPSPTTPASPTPINTTVTVLGWTRTGADATSPLVNVPMPGLQLNVTGVGLVTTDDNGQFTIDISSGVTVAVAGLDGRHHALIGGVNQPTGNFVVFPGAPVTIQLLTSAATVNQAAHTTAAWWIDKTNEWARSILGNTPQLATADAIAPTVNVGLNCNAFYTGNTLSFYQAGGGCSNSAFSTVIAHEWGHGLDDRYGGISQTNGLSEGWADIVAMYLTDAPDVGLGLQAAGAPLRNGNNATQYPCTGCDNWTAGQSWMGFAWKLRERLATRYNSRPYAVLLTNYIVLATITANATDQAGAVLQVYVADDNDGNLANGTPNKLDIDWACTLHSLPIPGGAFPPANNECANAIPIGNGVSGPFVNAGATTSAPAWWCTGAANDVWFSYTTSQNGTLTVSTCNAATWDTAIQIFSGSCGALTSLACMDDTCGAQTTASATVTPGVYYIRVGGYAGATGSFRLNVSGPVAVPAAVSSYGTGCYGRSRAFYESFAPLAFDLGGAAMRLAYDPAGRYVASAAGSYVPPSPAAVTLALGDDAAATVTLASPFSYPGGTTTTLEVCSNGFVSAAAGNGVGFSPNAADWLASAQPRWGCWHDFNPSAALSGQVKFEQIGNLSYVTWQAVYSYGTTLPTTFQLQFDRGNGAVTFAWATVNMAGNGWLVGFAAQGPSADLGSRDLSASLPGTFATDATNFAPLTLAGSTPTIGTTSTLTTTNYTATAPVAVQVLGLSRVNPGVDLAVLGMPGCLQYAAPTVLSTINVASGVSTYALSIPNNLALQGFQLFAQTVGFMTGANAANLVTSNGLALTVGI